jgi:hypothetical protein
MSNNSKVQCETHGWQEESFVCQHIATSLQTGVPVGFHWPADFLNLSVGLPFLIPMTWILMMKTGVKRLPAFYKECVRCTEPVGNERKTEKIT